MPWRIDNSMNDAPYQGIHVFNDEGIHILEFSEDDAPVHDFNSAQRQRAADIVEFMNSDGYDPFNRDKVMEAFKYASFVRPHERIKLEPKE